MSFNWSNNLTLAQLLVEFAANHADPNVISKEAILRCAIGRAYYAVFCPSRDYLLNNGHRIDPQSHVQVIAAFKNYGENTIQQKIGKKLGALRNKRNYADYDKNYGLQNLERNAAYAIMNASAIISDLNNL